MLTGVTSIQPNKKDSIMLDYSNSCKGVNKFLHSLGHLWMISCTWCLQLCPSASHRLPLRVYFGPFCASQSSKLFSCCACFSIKNWLYPKCTSKDNQGKLWSCRDALMGQLRLFCFILRRIWSFFLPSIDICYHMCARVYVFDIMQSSTQLRTLTSLF